MPKVLILDDSFDILDATSMLLMNKGYLVRTANNKQDFLSILLSFQPDVVIIDILLQDMDGREICRELRADPANSSLSILMFSASPVMLQDYSLYGADGCMEKPFESKELLKQ